MKKESVNKFDLEAAFKALEEIEIPVVKGIKPHRENLQEKFTKKLTSEILVEDYYDVNDTAELEKAQEEREAEIAKAKLARIEKIVDLDAESEEDLLPSYVGKVIIQCPQCMTLFYKNQEDIEKSEENPEVVNINEVCQHCGNSSGYTLIGKVDTVGEEEAENYDVEDFDESELNLDFPEGTEEVDPEGTGEGAEEDTEESNEDDLDLNLDIEETEGEEETPEEESDEEEVKESLREAANEDEIEEVEDEEFDDSELAMSDEEVEKVNEPVEENEPNGEEESEEEILLNVEGVKDIAAEAGEAVVEVAKENPEVEAEEIKEITDEVVDTAVSEMEVVEEESEEVEDEVSEEEVVEESLTEAVDAELDAKLKAHNEYIEYLKEEIEKAEKALEVAKNDFVKKSIQSKLDALKADLEAALPEGLKAEVTASDDLPTPEESGLEDAAENKEEEPKEETKESLNESLTEDVKIICDLSDYTPWSGAVSAWDKIQDAGKVDELDALLEECYPEGLTMTELNDILWFDAEWVFEALDLEEDLEEKLIRETTATPTTVRSQSKGEIVSRELAQHPLFLGISTRIIERCLIPLYVEDTNGDINVDDIVDYYQLGGGFGEVIFRFHDRLSYKQIKTFAQKDPVFMTAMEDFLKAYNIYPDPSFEEINFSEIFEICFEMRDNTTQRAREFRADTMKEIEKFYRKASKTNEELDIKAEESLVEASDLDTLLDSEEFKKPISDAEVSKIIAKYESLDEDVEPGVESEIAIQDIVDTWESVEEIDEESLDKLTEKYLKEVYSNVNTFKTTECSLEENKLVIEGKITFNSGKTKTTKFIYEATTTENNKVILEGLNADFATEKAFVLNCNLDTANRLVVESLNYKYLINNTLVEGLLN